MAREFQRQIFVCTKENFDGCCAQKGALEVFQALRDAVRKAQMTDVLVTGCGCTGQHSTGPTVIVHPDGIWYQQVKPEDVEEILREHLQGGKPVERLINPNIQVSRR